MNTIRMPASSRAVQNRIPKDFEVRPVNILTRHQRPNPNVKDLATCGTCGLSWDDARVTAWTPAPSGRCPFEYFHKGEARKGR